MGFTNVAWESRSTEALARALTDGPGPISVGQSGAVWIRVADELASTSDDFKKIVDNLSGAFASQGGDAAARKLDEYRQWLAATSLSAAGNGEQAEQAAVAYSAAVIAMPSVARAIQARSTRDVMASLGAYNGAVLNGQFAELDAAMSADHADAAAVMYQYEEACNGLATAWEQPAPPDVCTSAALNAERSAPIDDSDHDGDSASGDGSVDGGPAVAPPLAPFRPASTSSSGEPKELAKAAAAGGSTGPTAGPMGGGYGPMSVLARGATDREHQSSTEPAALDGGGEPGAFLSADQTSWLPTAHPSDTPFVVSNVSWEPDTSAFDELDVPPPLGAVDEPGPTLDQDSDRWISPPVIGTDKRLTL